jgi:anhydro-N-acetylmuramic acid kinase
MLLYIGIMSGTSLDGIDAVLADFSSEYPKLIVGEHIAFDIALRAELLALNSCTDNELERAALAGNQLAQHYATAVGNLLRASSMPPQEIVAIGCHGQTVRHQPKRGYSIQLNNPALLAELTAIDVVADFRSRDIAAGGQGAPLVPAFHGAAFAHPGKHRAIVNIGGIANITDVPAEGNITGFDCGPGNMLMDAWCTAHQGAPYDEDGSWAAGGMPIPGLLEAMIREPFFHQAPPKSTGRDLFNTEWLERFVHPEYAPRDVQATLLKLTVKAIQQGIADYCQGVNEVYVCGGGARNTTLINSLRHAFAGTATPVALTDALGVNAEYVEAMAFAWLAYQTINGQPGNLPAVTGARHRCVLGGIFRH